MQMLLKRFKKEEKGFTLIELLAVIVILAVIAVIAVPLIGNIISKSKSDSDLATARQIYEAAKLYATSETNGQLGDVTVATLIAAKYLDTKIYLPSNKKEILGTSAIDVTPTTVNDFITLTTGTGTDDVTKKYSLETILAQ